MRALAALALLGALAGPAAADPGPAEVVVPGGSTVTILLPSGEVKELRPAGTHFMLAADAAASLIADRDLARRLTTDLKQCEVNRAQSARAASDASKKDDAWRPLRWLAMGVTIGAGVVAGVWVGTAL